MSHATNAQKALRHEEARERLGLPIDFTLIDEFKHNRKQDITNEGKPNDGKNPLHHLLRKVILNPTRNLILH